MSECIDETSHNADMEDFWSHCTGFTVLELRDSGWVEVTHD